VSEQRCSHGFLRSVQPCPVCDAGKSSEPKAWSSATRREYRASTRERWNASQPHGLVGEFQCVRCGFTKPLSEYYISRSSPRGHQSRCKTCDNDKRSRYRRGEQEAR
jgi:hypothetical protein